MTGFLGDADISVNRIEALRARLSGYIDLTSANPTTQGQHFPADILARAAAPYWQTRRYAPDARGLLPARQAVAAYYAQRQPALRCDPTQDIFLTASTSEAYVLLFGLLANAGDNILAPAVSYPLFEYLAALFPSQSPATSFASPPLECCLRPSARQSASWFCMTLPVG